MTPARLAEIREKIALRQLAGHRMDWEEELLAALETEQARVDWMIAWLCSPKDDEPPWFVPLVSIAPEGIPQWARECIDSAIDAAREREKGTSCEPLRFSH